MNTVFLRPVIGWGFGLWLFGYLLGFAFYAVVPPEHLGWYIMPLGIVVTCIALWRFVKIDSLNDGIWTGIIWAAIAIVLDYLFIVKLLNPADGYYKLDVYLYYMLTFLLPVGSALLRRGSSAA